MKGRFLMLWSVAVIATTAAFVVHLALRFETVSLGYALSKARAEQRRLVEKRRLLSLEAATLRRTDRIEYVATHALGMQMPTAERIVTVETPQLAVNSGAGH